MRVYSPEWVAAFNQAVESLPAEAGTTFRLCQLLHNGPDGVDDAVAVILDAVDGRLQLAVSPLAAETAGGPEPDVTVSLAYDDAVALSRGDLDPGRLLADGRVKVRGDLGVLVRGQRLLAQAAELVAVRAAATD